MPHQIPLDIEIVNILRFGGYNERNALFYLYSCIDQVIQLQGIVGDEIETVDPQELQHLNPGRIISFISLESEMEIGIERIHALILELIGPDLVDQADAASFLAKIHKVASFLRDHFKSTVQLRTTITFSRTEGFSRYTFRVYPDKRNRPAVPYLTQHDEWHGFIRALGKS